MFPSILSVLASVSKHGSGPRRGFGVRRQGAEGGLEVGKGGGGPTPLEPTPPPFATPHSVRPASGGSRKSLSLPCTCCWERGSFLPHRRHAPSPHTAPEHCAAPHEVWGGGEEEEEKEEEESVGVKVIDAGKGERQCCVQCDTER
ncbi:hypothetical protein JZ751_028658 [Albula glossodonta]|uniref:Uncharacterized protein n=1 Tax=Albula glossodonta TaxID=121402 RepID=A0A8T2NIK9_9TELE|nr:hypothetical protein JZ751_028658 [Albula glossodonta]